MRKSRIWDSMILVLVRRPKSLANAFMAVYLLIVTTVYHPGTHATIMAVDVSARHNNMQLSVLGPYLLDTRLA